MVTKKVFLASSSELEDDRRAFEIFVARKNKEWVPHGVFLELVLCEDCARPPPGLRARRCRQRD